MSATPSPKSLQLQIRLLICFFIIGLVLSGATAIPLETEMRFLTQWTGETSAIAKWFLKIQQALIETNAKFPFIAYGTDWLAFGHFAIAVAFIGPLRDPVKNIWVIEFGMIACVLVVPYALLIGGIRGIPVYWRLIDCSFGVFGIVPLWICRSKIKMLEAMKK